MRKIILILIATSVVGAGTSFADESASTPVETATYTYGVKYDASKRKNEIWLENDDGTSTLLIDFAFPANSWTPSNSFSDVKTGKLYLWAATGNTCALEDGCHEKVLDEDGNWTGTWTEKAGAVWRAMTEDEKGFVVYDPSTNTIETGVKKGFADGYQKTFQSVFALDDLISEESDGSVHIGEDSLVTIEENGVQQLYATNASAQMININIKKGTDLLIDGVSVSGSLNTNATNIATNTTDIATNKTNIATNTTDIATNKTNIAINTTDIATNKTNIAANTAEIATYSASISSNTTAIAALGSDLSAFKSSTNSQMTYMKSDYSSGIASAVAMSQFNLAQEGFSVGIGRGSYNDEDETAFGLGYGGEFKNGTLFKLQASKSGDASGVGLTISF